MSVSLRFPLLASCSPPGFPSRSFLRKLSLSTLSFANRSFVQSIAPCSKVRISELSFSVSLVLLSLVPILAIMGGVMGKVMTINIIIVIIITVIRS